MDERSKQDLGPQVLVAMTGNGPEENGCVKLASDSREWGSASIPSKGKRCRKEVFGHVKVRLGIDRSIETAGERWQF